MSVEPVFEAVAAAGSEIRDALAERRSYEEGQNPSGERQLAADVYADDLLCERLLELDGVTTYASEERETVERRGTAADPHHVSCDPLDGSSNLTSNNAMGTIVAHAAGSIHSSAPVFPAALAAAEMTGASGRDLIAAVVGGYEIQIRLALALDPAAHYARGFHPTATCGVFGAAAAAGNLLGLDHERMVSAFGIALSQAAGSMQFLENGAWTKRSHVGQAAQNGLMAAVLASEGYLGPTAAFEGKAGFLNAYAPAADPAKAVAGLGEHWETMRLAVKPYPCCRYAHAAMDAVAALRAEHAIAPEEVEAITIGLPRVGMSIIGEPLAAKQAPENIVDGQFSMPFCAAVVLREGKMDWDDYPRHLADAQTLALCHRVNCVADADAEAALPANMAGRAAITTPRGTVETFVEVPRGEPANFLSVDEFRAKFGALAAPYLGYEAGRLAERLLSLDSIHDIRALSRVPADVV